MCQAGLNCSNFCDCQQRDYQIDMNMDDNEIEDKNNDSESGTEDDWFMRYDMIICCINVVWQCFPFSLPITLRFKYVHIVFDFLL